MTELIDDFIELIDNEKKLKMLVRAQMGTGKTTFAMMLDSEFQKRGINLRVLFVVPTLPIQAQAKANKGDGLVIVNGQNNVLELTDALICTTPDSYPKAAKVFKQANQPFITMYDEIQDLSCYGFRARIANPLSAFDKDKLCKAFIGLSATPDNMENPIFEWTHIMKVKCENPLRLGETATVYFDYGCTSRDIAARVLKLIKPNVTVVFINDNKAVNGGVIDILKTMKADLTFEKFESTDEGKSTLQPYLAKTKDIDVDVVAGTRFIIAGIELPYARDVYYCYFATQGTQISDFIQGLGRARKDHIGCDIIMQPKQCSDDYTLEQWNQITLDDAKVICDIANRNDKYELCASLGFLTYNYNIVTETYEYSIDTIKVNNIAFNRYSGQIMRNTAKVLLELKKHTAFTVDNVFTKAKPDIIDTPEFTGACDKIEGNSEAVSKEEKLKFESDSDYLHGRIAEYTEDELQQLIISVGDIPDDEDFEISDEMEEDRNIYHSDPFTETRRTFYDFKLMFKFETEKKILQTILNKKALGRAKFDLEVNDINGRFNAGHSLNYKSANDKKVYAVRNGIVELFGKELGIRLGDERREELLLHLKKKKLIKSHATLNKFLNAIYSFKNETKISTIKVKHKL